MHKNINSTFATTLLSLLLISCAPSLNENITPLKRDLTKETVTKETVSNDTNNIIKDNSSKEKEQVNNKEQLNNNNNTEVNKKNWQKLGDTISSSSVDYISLAIDDNNIPYIAFIDKEEGYKCKVKKFEDNKWKNLGEAFASNYENYNAGTVNYVNLKISKAYTPYVMFIDGVGGHVRKFNGINWESVGDKSIEDRFSCSSAKEIAFAIDNNANPYVVFNDWSDSNKPKLKVFNGSSWVMIGPPIHSEGIEEMSLVVTNDNNNMPIPYVAFRDIKNEYKCRVKKLEDGEWKNLGDLISTGTASNISLVIDANNIPYIAFNDSSDYYKCKVKKFEGNEWKEVGKFASDGPAFYISLAIDGKNIPYVAFTESIDDENKDKCKVKKFNGVEWESVGNPVSLGKVEHISLAIDKNNTPYVAFKDLGEQGNLNIYKY